MEGDRHHQDIKKHVRTYVAVFVALAILTILTVSVSYMRLALIPAIVIALIIASTKGSLVAGFFMHLVSEKKIIFWILALTFCFFLVLLFLPSMH